ncbi:DUF664 domain-containing protein [Nocardia sp. NRRL S-836]|uniref:mycothiol transferase n=1 Tax=Nocardia sp. NRRL S-836 TaxID=1519492 RepID=UPI0006AEDF6F|nr:DUF664 domain-containing protein [Nocardia sp. NRRL S-836]KOV81252.1 hypothetical protein ADL03_29495 [Nocardia sp. NRRL S-836]
MITVEQYLHFTGQALDGMADTVRDLGADRACRTPIPGVSSPYALLTHCLGVIDYWAGELVAGRPAHRDRESEFTAAGPVEPLLARVERTKAALERDVRQADLRAPLRAEPDSTFLGPGIPLDQGAALLHVYEELAQHHGHVDMLRAVIERGTA